GAGAPRVRVDPGVRAAPDPPQLPELRALRRRLRRVVVGAADRVLLRRTRLHDGGGRDDARRARASARAFGVSPNRGRGPLLPRFLTVTRLFLTGSGRWGPKHASGPPRKAPRDREQAIEGPLKGDRPMQLAVVH